MPLKVEAIIKLIEADGWYLVAIRGSHRQYRHPTKPGRVTIPGKPSRELSHGLQKSILRHAGLTRSDQP
jgi:predicted RNA binding protein YcfA (HicA-like mRNA interferase family)